MSLAKAWLYYLDNVNKTLIPLEEMSAQDAGKTLLQHFRGLKDPKVKMKDLAERYPQIDAGLMRKLIVKFQKVGLLDSAGAGAYDINMSVLRRARVV